MARYHRAPERPEYERDRWQHRGSSEERYRHGRPEEEEERGFWDRTGDEVRSWFGNGEAERRRQLDAMRREREGGWSRPWRESGRGYGRRETSRGEGTWSGGYGRDESEDWRHLRDYWGESDEAWGDRLEYRRREFSERDYRPTFGGENFGGLGGPVDWNRGRESQWGMTTRGNFVGRGPRNYKRSDERVLEDINEQLTRNPMIDATDVEVTVQDCEVTLRGSVDNRNAKRLAEDIAESVFGVRNVRNEIRVHPPGATMGERAA